MFLLNSTTAKRICCPIYWNVISLYMISLEVLTRWMKPHGLFQVIFFIMIYTLYSLSVLSLAKRLQLILEISKLCCEAAVYQGVSAGQL